MSKKKSNVDKIREAKERERANARERSVDNDILFSLPVTKVMLAALAVAIVLYVLSYVGEVFGVGALQHYGHVASYVLFALTFFLLVVARVQAKKLTRERRGQ
ncbi:hypothetical protein H6A35_08280 [Collinsella tanakaei]|uniref:hypothetical protein n=1 Tax=Collinsella sp. An271 TaxID=1965616 RepID=UPI000B394D1F|nr:hypothetical protein [Collinsella sp. An271]MBM6688859.1 hypothetical protein [Collinsella tanakaei]MBM6776584.1 hypothetical protein [Collinsella tanakaei]MCF6412864.1 hypothetical protein [Collinsella tanakaei]OUO60069.1 hypothetical protein B5F74_07640 [Collinsella sp. An271]